MSDYDPRAAEGPVAGWTAVVGGPLPNVPTRSPAALCGRAAGPIATIPANQNIQPEESPAIDGHLFDQLPAVIREAVDEWATKLMAQPWRFRR